MSEVTYWSEGKQLVCKKLISRSDGFQKVYFTYKGKEYKAYRWNRTSSWRDQTNGMFIAEILGNCVAMKLYRYEDKVRFDLEELKWNSTGLSEQSGQ